LKNTSRIAVLTAALAVALGCAIVLSGVTPLPELETVVKAANENVLVFDVACDCRTFVAGPNRGDTFIVNGKIFPAGTLPLGNATNDPTQAVNNVASIGTWTCRGQNSFPLPAALAAAYNNSPFAYFDWHFFLNDGRGLNAAGYPITPDGHKSQLSVSGGIGSFMGAAGQIDAEAFGTNVTGCPNFRAKFTFQPGSIRGVTN
jgi:hypothetical protein